MADQQVDTSSESLSYLLLVFLGVLFLISWTLHRIGSLWFVCNEIERLVITPEKTSLSFNREPQPFDELHSKELHSSS